MARLQLDDFLDDDGFETPPIPSTKHPDGKVYTIQSPDAKTGLQLSRMAEASLAVARAEHLGLPAPVAEGSNPFQLDDQDERDLYEKVLGSAFLEMMEDGVSWRRLQLLGQYMFLYLSMGEEAAEAVRRTGALSGEASAPNRSTRRTAAKSASRGSRASSKTPSKKG